MTNANATPTWTERYLAFLGLPAEPPSLDALRRLIRAQIERVVFENVTAIMRRARVAEGPVPSVDPVAMVDDWAAGRGGGVCFDLAPTFRDLLAALGYRVTPILAQISFPGSHHATLVELEGVTWLVDVGAGAPLWAPIPLDRELEIIHLGLGFRFRPGGAGLHLRESLVDGEWRSSCTYDLRPADPSTREAAYQRHQLAGETWVVGNLTMVRVGADAVHRLRDDELVTHTAGGKETRRLAGGEHRRAAVELFGLPELPVDEALAALDAVKRAKAAVA